MVAWHRAVIGVIHWDVSYWLCMAEPGYKPFSRNLIYMHDLKHDKDMISFSDFYIKALLGHSVFSL